MTALAKSADWISPQEYLEGELLSEDRHEYVDGRVYAMAGASDDHNRIAGDLHAELRTHLRGQRCEPFIGDMKVRIPPHFADIYYYPDVVVCCAPSDAARYYREQPAIIIEVLSEGTEHTDRREKMLAYRQIPSVQIYVLIEQQRIAATVLRRGENGWLSEELEGPDAVLRLETIGFETPLRTLYERTGLVATDAK